MMCDIVTIETRQFSLRQIVVYPRDRFSCRLQQSRIALQTQMRIFDSDSTSILTTKTCEHEYVELEYLIILVFEFLRSVIWWRVAGQ